MASASFGQVGQYTAPGALGIAPQNSRERLDAAVQKSRWRVGPLRIDPWFSLRNVRYTRREGEKSNITAGVGAGLRGYIPIGSKLVLSAVVLPEYTWSKERKQQRKIAGRYGLGLFYDANRLSGDLTASSSDQFDFASSEVNRQARVKNVAYQGRIAVPITLRLGFYVLATRSDQTITDFNRGAQDLGDLSRQTDGFGAGLYWQFAKDLRLSLGAGTSKTNFDSSTRDFSNDGDVLSAALDWNGEKLGANIGVQKNDLRPSRDSSFREFKRTTWNGQLRWMPTPRFSPTLYGQRSLGYSVESDQGTYLDERVGARLSFPIGRRLHPSLYYEVGRNKYLGIGRIDDVTSWGGALSVTISTRLNLSLSGRSTRITDDLGATRSSTELGGSVSLSIGSDSSIWY